MTSLSRSTVCILANISFRYIIKSCFDLHTEKVALLTEADNNCVRNNRSTIETADKN